MHRSHGQWWHHVEAPATATVLEQLQRDTGVRRALVATLELSVVGLCTFDPAAHSRLVSTLDPEM
jgi:hypothetical protein